ncbi:hypothetical protein NC653_017112 [Populus alba x Populus x berolinensis]|uniref:Uncharacterized protein n=1 Tax=Populus alba x Populus x berolinensis TaxID=444605 RepID=A0AAD6W0K5_9ROSI|nr:hypothetical protein NC653_017112 [Populus alba x Populus x berolinensis]
MAVHTKGTGLMPRAEETEDDGVKGAIEIEDDDANRLQNAEIEMVGLRYKSKAANSSSGILYGF